MIPRKSGDRIKTDHRDAVMLARLHRAGELTAVYVPDEQDEAMRDLTRAREDAVISARGAKQRLKAFLLRHGIVYSGKSKWSKAYFNWLSDLTMPHRAQQIAPQEYIDAVHENCDRVERLTDQIRQMVPDWRLAPVVSALQSARGVSLIVSTTLLSEIGDLILMGASPQTPGICGMKDQSMKYFWRGDRTVGAAPMLRPPARRSGCFPALPYPPDRRGQCIRTRVHGNIFHGRKNNCQTGLKPLLTLEVAIVK